MIGLPGVLNFTDITQPWLRAATRWWICEELPRRRTSRTYKVLRGHIQSMGLLSASLRRARADHGSDPSALGRSDILVFLTRQAYERDQDIITDTTLLRTGGRSN